jgi:hypothetical protein
MWDDTARLAGQGRGLQNRLHTYKHAYKVQVTILGLKLQVTIFYSRRDHLTGLQNTLTRIHYLWTWSVADVNSQRILTDLP